MKDNEEQSVIDGLVDESPQVDSEVIVEQIWTDLGGTTSRSDIKSLLMKVAPAYEDARIKTFVPIFLRRDVLRRLQGGLAQSQSGRTTRAANAASGKESDSARQESADLAKNYTRQDLAPNRNS